MSITYTLIQIRDVYLKKADAHNACHTLYSPQPGFWKGFFQGKKNGCGLPWADTIFLYILLPTDKIKKREWLLKNNN